MFYTIINVFLCYKNEIITETEFPVLADFTALLFTQ